MRSADTPRPPRQGGLGARFALLAASTCLALLLCEAALQWAAPAAVHSPYHCVWPPHLRAVFNPDPTIMPGIGGRARFVANSRGIRGDENPRGPAYRVLAVGGSTTECLFLDQTETWPHLLQQRLAAQAPAGRAWVGNAGKSGLTSRDHVVQLKYLLPELAPLDVVLFLIGVNDLSLRNLQDTGYDPLFLTREGVEAELLPRVFGLYPLRHPALRMHQKTALGQLARSAKRRLLAAGRDIQDQAGRNYVRWRAERRNALGIRQTLPEMKPALAEYARNVSTLIDLAQRHAARPVFLTQPTLWRVGLPPELQAMLWVGKIGEHARGAHEYYSVAVLAAQMEMYNDTLLETCRLRDVECFDLAAHVPKDGTVFYDDDHFTEEGARLVAALVAGFLEGGASRAPASLR